MLEKISGFSVEEAKQYLIANIRDDVTHEMAMKVKEIETQYKEEAEDKARAIIATAIQRRAADHASEITVSVVPLPNDEMKGRIIGREGRNIRKDRNADRLRPHHRRYPRSHHRLQLRSRAPRSGAPGA